MKVQCGNGNAQNLKRRKERGGSLLLPPLSPLLAHNSVVSINGTHGTNMKIHATRLRCARKRHQNWYEPFASRRMPAKGSYG